MNNFSAITAIPNSSKFAVLGTSSGSYQIGIFDSENTSMNSFPSLKDTTGSDLGTAEIGMLVPIKTHLPRMATQPPYVTTIGGESLHDPGSVITQEEILNLIPKMPLTAGEKEALLEEMYPPSYGAIGLRHTTASFDTSDSASQGFIIQYENNGTLDFGYQIDLTNYVLVSYASSETKPTWYMFLTEFGSSSLHKYYRMTGPSDSNGHKFGSPFIITTQYSGTTSYKEIFDYVSQSNNQTYDSRYTSTEAVYPILIGFPIT
jgi:hypothetical protein